MVCPQCGYAMSAFDTDCPRCHGKGISKPVQSTPTPQPPITPTQPPTPQQVIVAPQKSGFSAGVGIGIGICVGCVALPILFMVLIGGMTMAGKRASNTFNSTPPAIAYADEDTLRAQCQSNLKQLALASKLYVQANKETYPDLSTPDSIKAVLSGHTDNQDCFVCPKTMRPYKGNVTLSGISESDKRMNDSAYIVMFYEDEATHKGGRNAAYADGHVKWLLDSSWQSAKQASGIQ